MYQNQNKAEEVAIKRLRRLPEIARRLEHLSLSQLTCYIRIVKGIFVSEKRNALKKTFLLDKLFGVGFDFSPTVFL